MNGSLTGETEISKTENDILICPNQFTESLTVSGKEYQLLAIEIYNVLGEEVYKSEVKSQKQEINLSALPSGIYFVRIETENGVVSRKIIKQ